MAEGGPPPIVVDAPRGGGSGRHAPARARVSSHEIVRDRRRYRAVKQGSRVWGARAEGGATRSIRRRERWGSQGVAKPRNRRLGTTREAGAPVAASALAPPGPIPNPVVTQRSAGEYLGGDPLGGEAAAGTPAPWVI